MKRNGQQADEQEQAPGARGATGRRGEPSAGEAFFSRLRELLIADGVAERDVDAAINAVRSEYAGTQIYLSGPQEKERRERAEKVLRRFNGRNAHEVARELNICVATVYRVLKRSREQRRGAPGQ